MPAHGKETFSFDLNERVASLPREKHFFVIVLQLLPLLTSVEDANPKIVLLLKSWSQREASLVAKELFYSCCDHITRSFCEMVDKFSNPKGQGEEDTAPETDFETVLEKQMSVITNLLKGEKLVLQHRNRKVIRGDLYG